MNTPVFIQAGYAWRKTMRHTNGLDANAVGNEIAALTDQSFGAIVQRAQAEDSAMHTYFEWDDAVAGELWRVDQARELTRAIVLVVADTATEDEVQTDQRAFVALYDGGSDTAGRFAPNEAIAIPINVAVPHTPEEESDEEIKEVVREVFAPLIRPIAPAPRTERQQRAIEALRKWANSYQGDPLFAGVIAAINAIN